MGETKSVADYFYQRWRRQGAVEVHWRTLDEACTLHGEVDQYRIEKVGLQKDSEESIEDEECLDDRRRFTVKSSDSNLSEPVQFIKPKGHKLKYVPRLDTIDNVWYTLKQPQSKQQKLDIKHMLRETKEEPITSIRSSETFVVDEEEIEEEPEDRDGKYWETRMQDDWKELEVSSDESIREIKQRRKSIPFKPTIHAKTYKNYTSRFMDWIQAPLDYYEPLSVLQKLAEDYEYTRLLDIASKVEDEVKQLAYVGAFSATSLAMAPFRTAWQFLPFFGETYELDRTDDLGWYLLSECVSVKPPVIAQFCVSKEWICIQQFYWKVDYFKGEYIVSKQLSVFNVHFRSTGHHYSWKKRIAHVCDVTVRNYWIHNFQNYDIVNQKKNHICHFLFTPYENWIEKKETVKGVVMDENGSVRWVIDGLWNMKLVLAPVRVQPTHSFEVVLAQPSLYLGSSKLIWRLNLLPPECEKFYCFSYFACHLNEFDATVPPTDSRRRPDVRTFEEGNWSLCEKLTKQIRENEACRKLDKQPMSEIIFEKTLFSDADRYQGDYQHPIWFTKEVVPIEQELEVDDCSDVDEYIIPKWYKRKYIKRRKEDFKCRYSGNYYYLKWLQEWECPPTL